MNRSNISLFLRVTWLPIVLLSAPVLVLSSEPSLPPSTSRKAGPAPTDDEIFGGHYFSEPLVPVGGKTTPRENADLSAALAGYAKRSGPDDFSSLTGFLNAHPNSPWSAALLTDLGLEYYNTAHYSLAMDAWERAWAWCPKASDAKSLALVSRAFGEMLTMNSRLGRMDEMNRLLRSVGAESASERVAQARAALWSMRNRPEISFRCGPLAVRAIREASGLPATNDVEIFNSASTQKGCSLPYIAALSKRAGLNYQMVFRDSGDYQVPSVVHWKVGHYAAIIRKVGELYELQDPTFGHNTTWATKAALDAETSGYSLVAPGALPSGWRTVDEVEGGAVWGKGLTGDNDPQHISKNDLATGGSCPAPGMPVPKVHLSTVNLNLTDTPLFYTPPVGPPVRFTVRYNRREMFNPENMNFGNLGPQWTCDWFSFITDNPSNPLANVNLYVGGGGQRTYIGFNTNTQSFAYQQYDRNLLTRTGPDSYQLLNGDGSKLIFSRPDGAIGTSRNVFLTQMVDPQGNALLFGYDANLRLVSVTDAIGQVTTLTYGVSATNDVQLDTYKLSRVTDPFGRTATFDWQPLIYRATIAPKPVTYTYDPSPQHLGVPSVSVGYGGYSRAKSFDVLSLLSGWSDLFTVNFSFNWVHPTSVTDMAGITTRFDYGDMGIWKVYPDTTNNFVDLGLMSSLTSMTTPYGTTTFVNTDIDNGTTRSLEIHHPDGSRERVEYNQGNTNQPLSDPNPAATMPTGMNVQNSNLRYRNTYYWDRKASAEAYGDYSKARLYHFLHTENGAATAGALESYKLPLENRVWLDYAGQSFPPIYVASTTVPTHIGRVLDDGSTQLYTYAYNGFGHITNSIDPLGRTMAYLYDTNGIDLLEVRQTRAGKNELLAKMTYNSQHEPLTQTDAAGQTTSYSYNARGQMLAITNARAEITRFNYDANGFLLAVDGPLAGGGDTTTLTYDAFNRVRTTTDGSGYTLTFDYDNLNRRTRTTYPDGTFSQNYWNILDRSKFQDRAGRQTLFEYDTMRHLTKMTDPLGRTTLFDWCRCGQLASMIDPLGRMTSWLTDVQGRRIAKRYNDGSQVSYLYEKTSGRIAQVTDEQGQITSYTYNRDDSVAAVNYADAPGASAVTPAVSFTYDPDYPRVATVADGIGTTLYSYNPITTTPTLGAGKLAGVTGPLPNQITTYGYDVLGRPAQVTRDGATTVRTFDAASRIVGESNALGAFTYVYDGSSVRLASESLPNGINLALSYGTGPQDFDVQQIAYTRGATPVSKFDYGWDVSRQRIVTWSQQTGAQTPDVASYGYDAVNQLLSAAVTNSGALVNAYAYTYDTAGNRLSEQIGGSVTSATYNPLNQLTTAAVGGSRTNEWDAAHRLTAVNAGNLRTEFGYDGKSRLAYLRQLQGGMETSFRRFVWTDSHLSEERDKSGTNVLKRFYPQGVKVLTGPNAGNYFYTRDHLGSVRALTDSSGAVRARYAYDPWGRRTKTGGDLDTDFGFAGMFWSPEVNLSITHFRAYDPALGRWVARDPLYDAEIWQGPNLYAYVASNPVNLADSLGLSGEIVEVPEILGEIVEVPPVWGELVEVGTPDFWKLLPAGSDRINQQMFSGVITDAEWMERSFNPSYLEKFNPRVASKIQIRTFGSLSDIAGAFLGAELTILTMTDCNVVNGIQGLLRQGNGGSLNIYEDRMLKQLELEGL